MQWLTVDAFMLKGARHMRTSDFERYALGMCVAAALLAGCGGGVPDGLATAATSRAAQTSGAPASSQTGYVGILGGGPVYKHIPKNIEELKNSGFNELIVWSVEVGSTGDLNLNARVSTDVAGRLYRE